MSTVFTRVFLVIGLLALVNSAAFYLLSVFTARTITYHPEERAARTILDSVFDLVRAEHQNIEVESAPGKGSAFTVVLPVHARAGRERWPGFCWLRTTR